MIAQVQTTPIAAERGFYRPFFEVRIGHRTPEPEVLRDIISASYRDNLDQIYSFELTVNNWDAGSRELKYTDSEIFDPGQKLELWMGYRDGGGPHRMIQGVIKSVRMTYPAGGAPQLAVSGVNVFDSLREEQHTERYENLTDSEIASRKIGPRLGLPIRTGPHDEEPRHSYLVQENQYDLVFLKERAEAQGYELIVTERDQNPGTELYFGLPAKVSETAYRLEYRKTLVQFTVTLNTANQVDEVTVRANQPVSGETLEHTARRDELDYQPINDQGRLDRIAQTMRGRKEVSLSPPPLTLEETRARAGRQLKRIAQEMVKASGTSVGLPQLRAGRWVEIQGIGAHFSGAYFVTGTTHTIGGGGYQTQFECRRE